MKYFDKETCGIFFRKAVRFFSPVRSFIFPPLCLLCNQPRTPDSTWLCSSCITSLHKNLQSRNACPRCGQNPRRKTCTCDIVWDYPFEVCYSLFDFDDLIKKSAHQFKYKGFRHFAYYLGHTFAHTIPSKIITDIDIIIPVPLHFLRKMKRGYNQAEYFARGIHTGILSDRQLCANALRRKRHTRTQTKLGKEERQRNLKGAFAVRDENVDLLANKTVLLVDDIVTTGATTAQCTQALMKAGARSVKVLSFARD